MAQTSDYISIGKIVGTHGLKGDLVLKHGLGKKTALKDLKAIFVKDKTGSLLPWFLEIGKAKSETETFIKLEGVNTLETARPLIQKEVWLQSADCEKFSAQNAIIGIIGFSVFDHGKNLGKIEEIIEQPHQALCRLIIDGKDVFIPLHEQSLKKVDTKNKSVHVELPDGLLDIYLA